MSGVRCFERWNGRPSPRRRRLGKGEEMMDYIMYRQRELSDVDVRKEGERHGAATTKAGRRDEREGGSAQNSIIRWPAGRLAGAVFSSSCWGK